MGTALRSVAHDVGASLFLPATMAAVTLPVALAGGDRHALVPLAVAAAACAAAATWLVHRYRDARTSQQWPAVEVVALGWLLSGVVAAAVLWGIGSGASAASADAAFRDPVNALFEGLSGITSTGLTMVGGEEDALSATVQWWRSSLQWAGAIGVVLFAIGFSHTASGIRTLYEAEGRGDALSSDVRVTVRRTWAIYLGLTVAAVLVLLPTEHSPWEAVNHGITAISTGGFSITGDSLAGFGPGTKVVTGVIVVVGALSFVAHHVLFVQRDVRRWWRLTPVRAQAAVLVVGGVLAVSLQAGSEVAIVDRGFQWVSASATAGLAAVDDLGRWGTPVLLVTVLGMAIGAPSGSTGGGLKIDRVTWLAKAALARMRGDGGIVWDGREADAGTRTSAVRHAAGLAALWVVTIAVGTAAVGGLTGAPLRDVLFDVTSAVSNVGLSAGVVGADAGAAAKLVVTALMYLGRLELLVALTFVAPHERAT